MSLLDATQLTAWATLALAVLAGVTAFFAVTAARTQSQQVGLLRGQVSTAQAELDRQADERRRAQAAQVYMTRSVYHGRALQSPARPHVSIEIHNTSQRPVYEVHVHWADSVTAVQGGDAEALGTLPPGGKHAAQRPVPTGIAPDDFTAVASFRDAAGLRWSITPDGRLRTVPEGLGLGAARIATLALEDPTLTP